MRPVHWQARLPDLTYFDFVLWGYVKTLVYKTSMNSAEVLTANSTVATGDVQCTVWIFANIRSSKRRRYEACISNQDGNFEHFLLWRSLPLFVHISLLFAVLRIMNMFSYPIRPFFSCVLSRRYRLMKAFPTMLCYVIPYRLGIIYLFWNFVTAETPYTTAMYVQKCIKMY